MKNLPYVGLAVYLIGLILKILHTPYHTWILVLGIFLTLILTIVQFWVIRPGLGTLMSGLTTTSWMVYLLFVLKFFPLSILPLLISIVMTGFLIGFRHRGSLLIPLRIPITLGFLAIILSLTPTHERYYWLNIHFNPNANRDHITWDKYSWMLYINGEFEQAEIASEKSLRILTNDPDPRWEEVVKAHQERIKKRDWESYK